MQSQFRFPRSTVLLMLVIFAVTGQLPPEPGGDVNALAVAEQLEMPA